MGGSIDVSCHVFIKRHSAQQNVHRLYYLNTIKKHKVANQCHLCYTKVLNVVSVNISVSSKPPQQWYTSQCHRSPRLAYGTEANGGGFDPQA